MAVRACAAQSFARNKFWNAFSLLLRLEQCSPGGASENSPAIHRRDRRELEPVPRGGS